MIMFLLTKVSLTVDMAQRLSDLNFNECVYFKYVTYLNMLMLHGIFTLKVII